MRQGSTSFEFPSNLRSRVRQLEGGQYGVWLIGTLILLPIMYLLLHGNYSLILGMIFFGTILVAWLTNRTIGISVMFAFLLFQGDLRRLADSFTGPRPLDPLLLVVPVFTLYLGVPLLLRLKVIDPITKVMLAWNGTNVCGDHQPTSRAQLPWG